MNKFILEQLKKCKVAIIPDMDSNTVEMTILKQDKPKDIGIKVGDYYSITVEDYIIIPYNGFTLHDNWNKGIAPTDKDMKVEILQIMGKMVKVEAIGEHDGKSWCGWLPAKSFQINGEIK